MHISIYTLIILARYEYYVSITYSKQRIATPFRIIVSVYMLQRYCSHYMQIKVIIIFHRPTMS